MILELTIVAILLQAPLPPQGAATPAGQQQPKPAPKTEQKPPAQEPPKEAAPLTYSDTIVVTASRVKESILDAPASMTVINSSQIANSPAAGVGELLQGVGGLNVIQLNAREFEIAGRQATGVLGQSQLVLIDGRPANNGNSGMFWDQLPIDLDDVDQVEILHGPASSVWGANAMSAVINLRTKSPRQMQGLQFTAGAGERGIGQGSIRWADAVGKMSYKISGSYFHQDGWARPTTLPDGSPVTGYLVYKNPDLDQPKADFRLDYEKDADHVWSIHAGYGGTSGMLFGNDLPLQLTRSFYSASADVSYTGPSMDARISWGRAAGPYRSLSDGSLNKVSSTYPSAEINFKRAVNLHHLLVFGASTRLDYWNIAVVPKRSSRHSIGGYIEDQIFLGDKVRLSLGVHGDEIQASGPTVSPRASLLIKPSPRHAIRFSVSRGYRIPTPVESFLEFPSAYDVPLAPGYTISVPLSIVGNESLHPVHSLGIETGYTGELAGRHTFQATVYRTTATDNIQTGTTEFYSPEQPPPTWPFPASTVPPLALPKTISYVNTGEIVNEGVELALTSAWPRGISTSATYTFQAKPRLSKADPAFPILVNEPPRHQASGMIRWSRAPWRGSVNLIYCDRAFWTDVLASDPRVRGYSDSYVLLNVSAAYAIPGSHVELILKATNLLDQQIQQHVFGDVIRRAVAGYVRIDVKK